MNSYREEFQDLREEIAKLDLEDGEFGYMVYLAVDSIFKDGNALADYFAISPNMAERWKEGKSSPHPFFKTAVQADIIELIDYRLGKIEEDEIERAKDIESYLEPKEQD